MPNAVRSTVPVLLSNLISNLDRLESLTSKGDFNIVEAESLLTQIKSNQEILFQNRVYSRRIPENQKTQIKKRIKCCVERISVEKVQITTIRQVEKLSIQELDFSKIQPPSGMINTAKTVYTAVDFPNVEFFEPVIPIIEQPIMDPIMAARQLIKEMVPIKNEIQQILKNAMNNEIHDARSIQTFQRLKNRYLEFGGFLLDESKEKKQLDRIFRECEGMIININAQVEVNKRRGIVIEELFISEEPSFMPVSSKNYFPDAVSSFVDLSAYENKHRKSSSNSASPASSSSISSIPSNSASSASSSINMVPVGIRNGGANCSISSAVQVFLNSPYKRSAIKELPNGHPLAFLKPIIQGMERGEVIDSSVLRNHFKHLIKDVGNKNQTDATEVIIKMDELLGLSNKISAETRLIPLLVGQNESNFDKLARDSWTEYDTPPLELNYIINRTVYHNGAAAKNTKKIQIPNLKHTLSEMQIKSRTSGKISYSLKAVISHLGNRPGGGHYVSYINRGGQWYSCNDSAVKRVTEQQVMDVASNGSYLTFGLDS